jgi:hypothetical protein
MASEPAMIQKIIEDQSIVCIFQWARMLSTEFLKCRHGDDEIAVEK